MRYPGAGRARRGFTLIEIMVVVAIIAVLASILLINFLHAEAEARTASCEGNLKQIATAMEEYAVDNGGRYPRTLNALTTPYLSVKSVDPVSGKPYRLNGSPPAGASYEIDDAGGHDTDTTRALPNGPGTGSVIYVSNVGVGAR